MSDLENPYWYANLMIVEARRLLAQGQFTTTFLECLTEHNHGHSGFTDNVEQVFSDPSNPIEKALSDELHAIHLEVAQGLLQQVDSSTPQTSIERLRVGDNVSSIWTCLKRLGDRMPDSLLKEFRTTFDRIKDTNPQYFIFSDYIYHIDNWLSLKQLPGYAELMKSPERFHEQTKYIRHITRIQLWHTKSFFQYPKPGGKDNDYITNEVLDQMEQTITAETFLLVDIDLKTAETTNVSLPKIFENMPVWLIHKDQTKMYADPKENNNEQLTSN